MTDLVVVSLEAWDGIWRRNQHLVSRLLLRDPGLRVLFVEPAADPAHAARRGARTARGQGLRPGELLGAAGRLWLFQPTKWLPRRWDSRADSRLTAAVVRAASKIEMAKPVLWINDPAAADLVRLTPWPALYDVTDDWLAADRSARERERLQLNERLLLQQCRHVVVCSPRLLETKRAEHVTLIQNAVDLGAYSDSLPRPADLPSGKVIVYVGTLHRDRLDVELCVSLARALPLDATLALVGPIALSRADRTRITGAGAVLLGARDHSDVPAYLTGAEVLVVPHVVTAFTDSLDPIKVYEYLAASRPVVSTPVAGFRDLKASHVRIASGDRFVDFVLESLADDAPEVEAALVPTWDERAIAMSAVVSGLSH